MTMEGNPQPAAKAIVGAREALYDALLALMGHGDIPAAREHARTAEDALETLRAALNTLARVNGAEPEPDALGGGLSTSERDLILADLGELLEALGLGDYARPVSPHEVMQQCIAEVRQIRDEEDETGTRAADPWTGRPPGLRDTFTTRSGTWHTLDGREVHVTVSGYDRGGGQCEEDEQETVREEIASGMRCPACSSPDRAFHGGVPAGEDSAVQCSHIWHRPPPPPDPDRKPARTLLANESLAGYAPPRCNDGRCPDHVPCVNHCGTGQCSRCCTVCRRLAGTPSDPCPACPDYVSRCSAGIPLGQLFTGTGKLPRATHRDGSLCLHRIHDDGVLIYDGAMIQHVRDQQQLDIPASDLWVALDKPVVIPGAMTTGESPQGVTVTHIPTGIWVRSSSERSQLQNKAAALALLCEQQAVVKYVQEHHTPGKRS
jgi:hypothetical protein